MSIFKTIKNNNLYSSYITNNNNAIWMNNNYNQFAEQAYKKNVIANRCINMISKSASTIKYKLFQYNDNEKFEIKNHHIINILNKPNFHDSKQELLLKIYTSLMISGNCYLLAIKDKNNVVIEIQHIRSDRVKVLTNSKDYFISGYRYFLPNNKHIDYLINKVSGSCDILHIKNYNPTDDYYGLSPIESGSKAIDQHNQASEWNQALLQNGAKPSGALIIKNSDGRLSKDQFLRLKEQFEENYTGASNSNKPLLLEGGLDWKEMSLSPKDMDFIEAKNNSAREIALAFNVPVQLLGIPGDNKYSNFSEAKLAFWEQTILPLVEKTYDNICEWLSKLNNYNNIQMEADTSNINIFEIYKDKLWNRIKSADFLSDKEKREILGFSTIED